MLQSLPPLQIGQYQIRYPIVQGAMAVRVSGAKLAAAVANAGGVGVISAFGLGYYYSDYWNSCRKSQQWLEANRLALTDELYQARQLSPRGILGVNLLVATRGYLQLAQTAVSEGANIIFTGAGLPLELPEYTAHAPDVALVPAVASVEAALTLCQTWKQRYNRLPDALIVENCQLAGGHIGTQCQETSDFSIATVLHQLRTVLNWELGVKIPLIAAGGVWQRSDIERYLAMGASGVQVGTRFIATPECDAAPAYKAFHGAAKAADVEIVLSPVGKPARVLKNEFSRRLVKGLSQTEKRCVANCLTACLCRDRGQTYCLLQALTKASQGDVEQGLVFSGANVGRTSTIIPVEELMQELAG